MKSVRGAVIPSPSARGYGEGPDEVGIAMGSCAFDFARLCGLASCVKVVLVHQRPHARRKAAKKNRKVRTTAEGADRFVRG